MKVHPSQIYDIISKRISHIISNIEQNTEDQLKTVASDSLENLRKINEKIQNEYHDLKKSSEWNRFTIAFYGETNAGKSTLIEALRLLWREESKIKEQEQFRAIQQKSGLTQEAFDNIQKFILDSEEDIRKSQNALADLERKHAHEAARAQAEIQRLTISLQEISDQQGWWKKFLARFFPPPEKHQLSEAKNDFDLLLAKQANEKAAGENALSALQSRRDQLEEKDTFFKKEAEELSKYADGQIIGDGRSDFTRHNTEFEFNVDNRSFILIDVPGIEGDENIVQTPIKEAVSKAHAVFYVTRNPRPPQSHEGEAGNKEGTLEKIKKHLGAQTEVWAIYNHPVNNPRMLKTPLLDEGSQKSLRTLDEKLKEKLERKYCGSFIISARAAYLGLTKCVVPGSKEADGKRKFLERFTQEDLLEKSGLIAFSRELLYQIMDNYPVKIRQANFNKASCILKLSLEKLQKSYESFKKTDQEVSSQNKHTISSIDQLLGKFKGKLGVISKKEIRRFSMEVERQVYEQIEKNISNAELKDLLKQTLEKEKHNLENNFQQSIRKNIDEFTEEVENIMKRASEHLKNIMATQERRCSIDTFYISINIDNGINIWNLISTGVKAVLLVVSSWPRWPIAITQIVDAVRLLKSLQIYFDPSFRQSQQRKSTDETIEKARNFIETALQENITSIQQEMEQQIGKVKEEIALPGKQCKIILSALSSAHQQLSAVDARIDSQLHQGKSA